MKQKYVNVVRVKQHDRLTSNEAEVVIISCLTV